MSWRFAVKEQMWALYWTAEMSVFITLMFITHRPPSSPSCLLVYHLSCGLHFLILWFSWSRSFWDHIWKENSAISSFSAHVFPWTIFLCRALNNNNLAFKLQYYLAMNYYLLVRSAKQSCLFNKWSVKMVKNKIWYVLIWPLMFTAVHATL